MFFKKKKSKAGGEKAESLFVQSQNFPIHQAMESAMSLDFGLESLEDALPDPRATLKDRHDQPSALQLLESLEVNAPKAAEAEPPKEDPDIVRSAPLVLETPDIAAPPPAPVDYDYTPLDFPENAIPIGLPEETVEEPTLLLPEPPEPILLAQPEPVEVPPDVAGDVSVTELEVPEALPEPEFVEAQSMAPPESVSLPLDVDESASLTVPVPEAEMLPEALPEPEEISFALPPEPEPEVIDPVYVINIPVAHDSPLFTQPGDAPQIDNSGLVIAGEADMLPDIPEETPASETQADLAAVETPEILLTEPGDTSQVEDMSLVISGDTLAGEPYVDEQYEALAYEDVVAAYSEADETEAAEETDYSLEAEAPVLEDEDEELEPETEVTAAISEEAPVMVILPEPPAAPEPIPVTVSSVEEEAPVALPEPVVEVPEALMEESSLAEPEPEPVAKVELPTPQPHPMEPLPEPEPLPVLRIPDPVPPVALPPVARFKPSAKPATEEKPTVSALPTPTLPEQTESEAVSQDELLVTPSARRTTSGEGAFETFLRSVLADARSESLFFKSMEPPPPAPELAMPEIESAFQPSTPLPTETEPAEAIVETPHHEPEEVESQESLAEAAVEEPPIPEAPKLHVVPTPETPEAATSEPAVPQEPEPLNIVQGRFRVKRQKPVQRGPKTVPLGPFAQDIGVSAVKHVATAHAKAPTVSLPLFSFPAQAPAATIPVTVVETPKTVVADKPEPEAIAGPTVEEAPQTAEIPNANSDTAASAPATVMFSFESASVVEETPVPTETLPGDVTFAEAVVADPMRAEGEVEVAVEGVVPEQLPPPDPMASVSPSDIPEFDFEFQLAEDLLAEVVTFDESEPALPAVVASPQEFASFNFDDPESLSEAIENESEKIEAAQQGVHILASAPLVDAFRLLLVHHEETYALMVDNGEEAAMIRSYDTNPLAENNTFSAVQETVIGNKVLFIVRVGDWQGIVSIESDEARLQAEI